MPSKGKAGRRRGSGKKKAGGGPGKDASQANLNAINPSMVATANDGHVMVDEGAPVLDIPPNVMAETQKQILAQGSIADVVPDSWEDLDGNGIVTTDTATTPTPPESENHQESMENGAPNAELDEDADLENELRDMLTELPTHRGISDGVILPRSVDGSGNLSDEITNSEEAAKDERIQELEEELLAARQQHSTMEGELEHAKRISDTRSRQLHEVQDVMQEMEEKVQALQGALQEADRDKSAAVTAASDREKEIEQHFSVAQREYQSIRDQLSSSLEENTVLKDRLASSAQDSITVGALQQDVQMLKSKCSQLDDELASANVLSRDQSKMLAEASVHVQQLEGQIKELENQGVGLMNSLDQKDGELNQMEAEVANQKHEYMEIKFQYDALATMLAESKQQNDVLASVLDEKNVLVNERENLLGQREYEIQVMQNQLSNQDSETQALSELRASLGESQEEIEVVRKNLKAAIKKGKRFEQEKQNLEVQIQEERALHESNQLKQKELEDRVAHSYEAETRNHSLLSEMEETIRYKDQMLAGLQQAHSEIETKLHAAVKKGKRIEQAKKELEAQVSQLVDQSALDANLVAQMESEIGELRHMDFNGMETRAAQAETKVDHLAVELEEAQKALEEKTQELDESLSVHNDLQSQLQSLDGQLQSMEEENGTLRAKCGEMEEESASRASTAEADKARLSEDAKKMEEEVGQHRVKVARAREGIEKMKQEKEVLIVQVEELSDRVACLELENAELLEQCENQQGSVGEDEGRQNIDPDLDDWVHRALHAERKATEAEAQKHAETGALMEKLSASERSISAYCEKMEGLERSVDAYMREASQSKEALLSSTTKIANLEAELSSFHTKAQQIKDLKADLAARDMEIQQIKESSNPPSVLFGSSQELGIDLSSKIQMAHDAARSLAGQMGLPFYESSSAGEDGALDAVRILLEGVGFGMQRQQQKLEEQSHHIMRLSNVQNELEETKNERENLERELERHRRLSSSGSGHLSIDLSGPPVEPVPSAHSQPVAKKRRDVHDVEAGVPISEIEEVIEDDHHSAFLPLTVLSALKTAPPSVNYGMAMADRAYLATTKTLGGKPVVRMCVAAYLLLLHAALLTCLVV